MKTRRWPAVGLLAVFSLALVLRLLGPMGALPDKEGYVALCTGSEIVYIPLSDLDGGNGDDRQTHSETCDWFFQFHALASMATPDPAPQVLRPVARLRPALARMAESPTIPRGFHARAPPVPVHPHAFSNLI